MRRGNKGKKHTRTHSSSLSVVTNSSGKFDPRAALSVEQNETLNEFISRLQAEGLTEKESKFCDEACLLRYLRARDWDSTKANKMLRDTLQWREDFKPELISAEHLTQEASSGKMYRRGVDKFGRPVIFMSPGKENSTDYVKNVKLLVYTLERAVDNMPDGVEQMTWLIDFNGYSRKNNLPYGVCMEVLGILSNHYPERLGSCFMVDTPWLFSLSWKAISPFVNPVTKSKLNFVSGSADAKRELLGKFFDLTQLDKKYCGDVNFEFSSDVYWKNEIEMDNARIQRNGLVIPAESSMKQIVGKGLEGDWPEEVEDSLPEQEAN
ncbi:hypothetical protein AKO1_005840 [Acrasis kona]|uniref:CRAL-TRIO domain-containing protein n=1 Tax=Acrasis kona TaxID=1008807 RepID=A0AAW2YMA5_9EUKA